MLVALLACCCLLSACGDRSKDREKAKVKFATKVLRPETLVPWRILIYTYNIINFRSKAEKEFVVSNTSETSII